MRFLITAGPGDGDPQADADKPFDPELLAAYMKYNEELHQAGVLVASEGLSPAAAGARIGVSNGKRVLLDGPFAETKELLGGFYLLDVSSRDEAIAWALRCPVGLGTADVLELHQLTSADDIPPALLALIAQTAPGWSASFQKPR
jgi:hypothetical protein